MAAAGSALMVFALCAAAMDFATLPATEFLAQVRQAPREECWVQMSGSVEHRRRGRDTVATPLYLGLRFTPERILAQVVADSTESYRIGQVVAAADGGTTVIAENVPDPAASRLAGFGLRPEDLTLSFIYWEFDRELPPERLRTRACRVLQLKAPDGRAEWVRVAFCVEALFPLRVEWVQDKSDGPPSRTLEIASFRKEAGFWLVDGLSLQGPGWRSRVTFDACAVGRVAEGVPADLFREVAPPPPTAP
jgi:hypothetical protein